ncbi:MAG: hypothetical protein HQL83_02065 [Magnetococcales bacterium]|nr:hypothetical protein [Magnetococcales bacterium]MBF0349176.1 hypothetical protein [Magnetococcales bacterium]
MILLNSLQTRSVEWWGRGRMALRQMSERLVTFSQPWVQRLSAAVAGAEGWQSWFQDSALKTIPASGKSSHLSEVELYSPSGTRIHRNSHTKGVFNPGGASGYRSHWPRNAYDLDLSETAMLTHGIATHATASSPGQQDFIHHVLDVRKQGGYDSRIFDEAKQLLRQLQPLSDAQPDA